MKQLFFTILAVFLVTSVFGQSMPGYIIYNSKEKKVDFIKMR